jgi:hypothetical protein
MPLQKALRGFTDAIGEYSLGEVKLDLDPLLQPQIDAQKYLMAPTLDWKVESATYAAFSQIRYQVPDNETWLVYLVSGQLMDPVPATQKIQIRPVLNNPLTTARFPLESYDSDLNTTNAGTAPCFSFYSEKGLLVPAGWFVGGEVVGRTGATAVNMSLLVQYSKFRS